MKENKRSVSSLRSEKERLCNREKFGMRLNLDSLDPENLGTRQINF